MTYEEIEALQPGRETDRLVAIHVLDMHADGPYICREDGHGILAENLPHYSTDIAAAWEVVEKFIERKWSIEVSWPAPGGFACQIRGLYAIGNGDTPMLAICKAALLAVQPGKESHA